MRHVRSASGFAVQLAIALHLLSTAAQGEFQVVGPTPTLVYSAGGGTWGATFDSGRFTDEFGLWVKGVPGATMTVNAALQLEYDSGALASGDHWMGVCVSPHVFSPLNGSNNGFHMEWDLYLDTSDSNGTVDLLKLGPFVKLHVNRPLNAIIFEVRDDLDQTIIFIQEPFSPPAAFASLVHAVVDYVHSPPGTWSFAATDTASGGVAQISAAYAMGSNFSVAIGGDGKMEAPGSIHYRWDNIVTNLEIPAHYVGSNSSLEDTDVSLVYKGLPVGQDGVIYTSPGPAININYVADPAQNVPVSSPTALVNYHALVFDAAPGGLADSPISVTMYTTGSLPGDSLLWFPGATVAAFFPNVFLAPGMGGNPSPTDYLFDPTALNSTAPGIDLALSGWMETPRPGFPANTLLYISNLGDQKKVTKLDVTAPAEFLGLSLSSSDSGDTCTVTPPTAHCDVTPVYVGEHRTFTLSYTVSTGVSIGDLLTVDAELDTPGQPDLNPANDATSITEAVQASWDPNDKVSIPSPGPIEAGENLHYVIRFENLGSIATTFITIADTLDAGLDLSSLAYVSNGGVLDLPTRKITWSLNLALEPGEHGYVDFYVDARDDLAPGAEIRNSAEITFDYNPPITTPEVVHTIEGVVDVEPPVLSVSVAPNVLWPPDHQMVQVVPTLTVTDNVDPDPVVTLLSVVSNEPDDAPGGGDGNTTGDVQLNGDGAIFLRAERSAQGGGRVYTLTYQATDDAGNTGQVTVNVTVPHDQGS